MSADSFDALLSSTQKTLSILKRHKTATISTSEFKEALEGTLASWAAVRPVIGQAAYGTVLDGLLDSATVTAESTKPSTKLLRSKFGKIRTLVRKSKLAFVSTALPHRYSELKSLAVAIRNPAYRDFIDEALRCWLNKTTRAVIVTAWCAVEAKLFDIFRTKWTVDEIKEFIPEAMRSFIRIHDDLTYLSDDALLRGLHDKSVLALAEYRLLGKVCKTYRDLAAHASLKRNVLDDEISANLRIILDFLSKSV